MTTLWVAAVERMFFVYLLKSEANGKSYVGFTSKEVGRRLEEHNIGSNPWTMANRPFKLVYYEFYVCKTDALLREKFFKTGVGSQIKELIVKNFTVNSNKI